jgi:hypothetical protein
MAVNDQMDQAIGESIRFLGNSKMWKYVLSTYGNGEDRKAYLKQHNFQNSSKDILRYKIENNEQNS